MYIISRCSAAWGSPIPSFGASHNIGEGGEEELLCSAPKHGVGLGEGRRAALHPPILSGWRLRLKVRALDPDSGDCKVTGNKERN